MGELARGGRTPSTRASYERYLFKFVDQLERQRPDIHARDVSANDCRAFLDNWIGKAAFDRLHDSQRPQWSVRLALLGRRD